MLAHKVIKLVMCKILPRSVPKSFRFLMSQVACLHEPIDHTHSKKTCFRLLRCQVIASMGSHKLSPKLLIKTSVTLLILSMLQADIWSEIQVQGYSSITNRVGAMEVLNLICTVRMLDSFKLDTRKWDIPVACPVTFPNRWAHMEDNSSLRPLQDRQSRPPRQIRAPTEQTFSFFTFPITFRIWICTNSFLHLEIYSVFASWLKKTPVEAEDLDLFPMIVQMPPL